MLLFMKEYDFYSTPIDLNIDANGNIFTTIDNDNMFPILSLSLSALLYLSLRNHDNGPFLWHNWRKALIHHILIRRPTLKFVKDDPSISLSQTLLLTPK